MKFSKIVMAAAIMLMALSTVAQAGVLDQLLFGAKAKPKYEALPPAKVFSQEEFEALADGPKLVVLVTKYDTPSVKNEDVIIEKYRRQAGKAGADGLYVKGARNVREEAVFSKSLVEKLKISAEAFRLEEPNLDKIKFILEKRAEPFSDVVVASDVYIKSIMHQIVAQKYDISDYILKLVMESPKYSPTEKNIMLDGYKALLGDGAIDGIKRVKVQRGVEEPVRTHALALLTMDGSTGNTSVSTGSSDTNASTSNSGSNDDGLYKLIVTRNKYEANMLIFDYTKNATPAKIEKLRKLMKNHSSEVVRTEAGKTLVRLKDIEFVENALQAERSDKVITAVKQEMLL